VFDAESVQNDRYPAPAEAETVEELVGGCHVGVVKLLAAGAIVRIFQSLRRTLQGPIPLLTSYDRRCFEAGCFDRQRWVALTVSVYEHAQNQPNCRTPAVTPAIAANSNHRLRLRILHRG
jgi:hypothetical protein